MKIAKQVMVLIRRVLIVSSEFHLWDGRCLKCLIKIYQLPSVTALLYVLTFEFVLSW